ncbi:hypothetical protein [Promicromonospora iranensis]|uniref:Uncharacterized protein n=1 Tax=Promicromonospora iranensis TaxID=1105144 RepID=A0ABU2CMI9_9MICO|nr:hypothetical protein [Promicromonospora iranensis]MDR7382555.1 hypothetical protein [Promicromonospora iranensis]
MTDEAHTLPSSARSSEPGADAGPRADTAYATPVHAGAAQGPWYVRVLPAAGGAFRRFGRWLATWGRRLASSPFLWAGIVLGFGTSLLVWESVLLLGVVVWLLGVWLWKTRGRSVLVALGLGIVLGWLPMLFFFVGSLPHTMIGLPGVEYDL